MHFDRSLAIGRRRKRLRLLGRNRGVPRDHRRRHAAQGFNRQGQRSYVEQEQVLHFALEHAALYRRTHRDDFIRIDALVPFFAEQLFHELLDARHARLSANQNDFIDLRGVQTGILHALFAGADRLLNDVFNHAFQLGSGQLLDQVLGTGRVGRDERQIDFGLHRGRELDLGALGCVAQTLQRHLVALATQVEAFVLLEFIDKPVHDALVEVVAAEVRVTIGGFDFDHTFSDFEDRNVERSAAEIVHGDGLVFTLVETVGERCRRRFVDDALHFETGNLAGIFGRLPLRVIEVRRHRDDGFGDFFTDIVFRGLLQLLQNQRRNLRWGVLLPLREHCDVIALPDDLIRDHLDFFCDFVVTAAHEPLDRVHRVFRISNGLPLGHLAHQTLPGLGKADYGRRSPPSFFIGDDLGLATFHDSYARIGGAQVNSNNLTHKLLLLNFISL